jgi:hypothetical protein
MPEENGGKNFGLWLNRITEIAGLRAEGQMQQILAAQALDCLTLAEENRDYREAFVAILNDASTTCGDRVALSFLELEIMHNIVVAKKDPQKLAHHLVRGRWMRNELTERASEKMRTLPAYDDVEVYLAYLTQLRDELNFAASQSTMLYRACSAVTDTDLSRAKDVIHAQLEGDRRYKVLCKYSEWQEVLCEQFPELRKMKEEEEKEPAEVVAYMVQKTKEWLSPFVLSIEDGKRQIEDCQSLQEAIDLAQNVLDNWDMLLGKAVDDKKQEYYDALFDHITAKVARLLGRTSATAEALAFAADEKYQQHPQIREFVNQLKEISKANAAPAAASRPRLRRGTHHVERSLTEDEQRALAEITTNWKDLLTKAREEKSPEAIDALRKALTAQDRRTASLISSYLHEIRDRILDELKPLEAEVARPTPHRS